MKMMFNFLIFVGLFLIALGLYGELILSEKVSDTLGFKNKERAIEKGKKIDRETKIIEDIIKENKPVESKDLEFEYKDFEINDTELKEVEINDTHFRNIDSDDINEDDQILFDEVLNSIIESDEVDEKGVDNSDETFEIMQKYESGLYTLEEVCNLLNMKKGEVLLLRNIYKNL